MQPLQQLLGEKGKPVMPSSYPRPESVDSVCRDGMDMPYVAMQTEAWKTNLTY